VNKKTLTAIVIVVAILSTLTTRAIDKSGGLSPYIINVLTALGGGVDE
jgi:hypothetical protein